MIFIPLETLAYLYISRTTGKQFSTTLDLLYFLHNPWLDQVPWKIQLQLN